MFKKPKQIIGVELGSACLKAAVIEFNERTERFLVREYSIQSVEETSHDLVTSLGLLLGKLRTRCRDCAIAAWPESSIFRFFEHDTASAADMRKLLAPEGNSGGKSDALEGYILDFVDTGKGKQSPKGRLYVGCGVPRKELESVRAAFQQHKYNVQLYQLTPIAVFNAFQTSLDEGPVAKPFFTVDFGRKRSSVTGGDSSLHLMRTLEWGAEDLLKALVEEKVIAPGQTLREATLELNEIRPAMREAIAPLVRQLSFTLDYLRNEVTDGVIREVYVSGGVSSFDVLVEAIQEMLGVPLVKWNPFRRMEATNSALKESGLLLDLFRLQAAAGAAIQYLK